MLVHYVTYKCNISSKMAATENSEWPYVCNYQLKFDYLGVDP